MKTKKITEVPQADLSREANLIVEVDEELKRVPSLQFRKLVEDEQARAEAAEQEVADSLERESIRAVSAEQGIADSLTAEADRATRAEIALADALTGESGRAKKEEKALADNLAAEITRAKASEEAIADGLSDEISRAGAAEKVNAGSIISEADRAKAQEAELRGDIRAEKARAEAAESSIRDTVSTNKPNWDDKYTRNEVDNQLSALAAANEWKGSVGMFEEIALVYPEPEDGWTVNVRDTDYTYRYDGTAWIPISANAIPKATQDVDGLLAKEDKADYDDAFSKRHDHGNKSVIDNITQALLGSWNAAYTHISDAVRHITSVERARWDTVTDKVDKVSGKGLSSNDYTAAEKTKLSGVAAGAEVNVQPDWNVADAASDAFIKNKPASMPASDVAEWAKAVEKPSYGWTEITGKPGTFTPSAHTHTKAQVTDMPTKLSQFSNDKGFITSADVDTSQNHAHSNKTVLDKVTQAMLDKLAGIIPENVKIVFYQLFPEYNLVLLDENVLYFATEFVMLEGPNLSNVLFTVVNKKGEKKPLIISSNNFVTIEKNFIELNDDGHTQCLYCLLPKHINPEYSISIVNRASEKEFYAPQVIPGEVDKFSRKRLFFARNYTYKDNDWSDNVLFVQDPSGDIGPITASLDSDGKILPRFMPFSIGEGNIAEGEHAIAFGFHCSANGYSAFSMGDWCNADGFYSSSIGWMNEANDPCAHAFGCGSIAKGGQFALGHYNDDTKCDEGLFDYGISGTAFCIGNGNRSSERANAARIQYDGSVIGLKAYQATGADYAEFVEWEDGNPDNEDRRGMFVTPAGKYIRKAEKGDFILGIVSANPAVIGNNDEGWLGRYIMDDFGGFIVEKCVCTDEKTGKEIEFERFKENPGYIPGQKYTHRKDRKEWALVGMLGFIHTVDDGTCEVGGFCNVGRRGVATKADTGYYISERVNENIIKVFFR